MTAKQLLRSLHYDKSAQFVTPERAGRLPPSELSFALRHLARSCEELSRQEARCGFLGAYILQQNSGDPAVPVTYAFEVESDADARRIHRMVWNQSLVPFLIVSSPSTVRVYPGFSFSTNKEHFLIEEQAAALDVGRLAAFEASAIDEGRIWEEWGQHIDPTQKADECLLRDLLGLDQALRETGLSIRVSHGLIGKFVYLRYLRERRILSDRKLAKWDISPDGVFSRDANLKEFRILNERLQAWLNGSVFTIGEDAALNDISEEQLQLIAGAFCGDSPISGQLHLDFPAYDFSHIPIEALSCVYEQFLHAPSDGEKKSRGKTLGAYYTPVPVADYMISEMERKRPLRDGMTVLDPSCGSGVFLVQYYRRLIEKSMREEDRHLRAAELRDLLEEHVFGIDRDPDACRVAELSLVLTLLDYINPPDLESTTFKLPTLRESNIFQDDFFETEGRWQQELKEKRFDWIVGNPPWTEIRGIPQQGDEQFAAWRWMAEKRKEFPTSGKQLAEAFLWKVGEHLASDGVASLLLPSMTFFKKEGEPLRQRFFQTREVWCLVNFANLAYVLFKGRAEVPASAVFFSASLPTSDHFITTFAPLVAEQVANRPQKPRELAPTWSIVVNSSELREIPNAEAICGKATTWKLAMWGASRDARLLDRMEERFEEFATFADPRGLLIREGLQLRDYQKTGEPLEHHPELAGKHKLNSAALNRVGRVFSFPSNAILEIKEEEANIRKRGGKAGLRISQPPHVVLDASRRFAVFSDTFLLVPPRQVGISGPPKSEPLLRALSLYLSSDFCTYQQFFTSPQWGVFVNRADLAALKKLPIPFNDYSPEELSSWSDLQCELAALSAKKFSGTGWQPTEANSFRALLQELNQKVYGLMKLRPSEQWLVEDFVKVNLELNKGKVAPEAMRPPRKDEILEYLTALRDCLDGFLPADRGLRHQVDVITDQRTALFSVSLQISRKSLPARLLAPDQELGKALFTLRDSLRRQHSQWVYFDRALKVYHEGTFYHFKPMQRHHWTRRQAVLDSDEIIAETLIQEDGS